MCSVCVFSTCSLRDPARVHCVFSTCSVCVRSVRVHYVSVRVQFERVQYVFSTCPVRVQYVFSIRVQYVFSERVLNTHGTRTSLSVRVQYVSMYVFSTCPVLVQYVFSMTHCVYGRSS